MGWRSSHVSRGAIWDYMISREQAVFKRRAENTAVCISQQLWDGGQGQEQKWQLCFWTWTRYLVSVFFNHHLQYIYNFHSLKHFIVSQYLHLSIDSYRNIELNRVGLQSRKRFTMKAHLNKIKYTLLNQCTKDDRNDDKLFLESQISDLSV